MSIEKIFQTQSISASSPLATVVCGTVADAIVDSPRDTAGGAIDAIENQIAGDRHSRQKTEQRLQNNVPCIACGSPGLWVDAFGNVRCDVCEPPPNVAMVREWWMLMDVGGCVVDGVYVRGKKDGDVIGRWERRLPVDRKWIDGFGAN